jgi:hypothetical protein
MELTHLTGESVKTEDLSDVDSFLLEETQKLYANYAKFNRQLFLAGEVRATTDLKAPVGCFFFHTGTPKAGDTQKDLDANYDRYFRRINNGVMNLSAGTLRLAVFGSNDAPENQN